MKYVNVVDRIREGKAAVPNITSALEWSVCNCLQEHSGKKKCYGSYEFQGDVDG